MIPHKISIKLHANSQDIDEHKFVPVFHQWIQTHAVADHLLIDVADYAHVPDGPGTVLVSHEANIYIDRLDGRLGLTYTRKQAVEGDLRARTKQAVTAASTLATMLELDPAFDGKLSFNREAVSVTIFDRLLAPNTRETFEMTKDAIQRGAGDAIGQPVTVTHATADAAPEAFGVEVKLA